MIRRHHLIEEAKAELDLAFEEIKRAEKLFIENTQKTDIQYYKKTGTDPETHVTATGLHSPDYIQEIYKMQHAAVQRFSLISTCFAIVNMHEKHEIALDKLKHALFRGEELDTQTDTLNNLVEDFFNSLNDYTFIKCSKKNDMRVRNTWKNIEVFLKDLGRDI